MATLERLLRGALPPLESSFGTSLCLNAKQLVYDAKGQYVLTESSPAKGAAKRRASFQAKQEQTLAADALAGMASA